MVTANLIGLMEEFIKGTTVMIKNTVKGFTHGQMVEYIKVDSQMENNMVKEFINSKMDSKFTAYGSKVKKV